MSTHSLTDLVYDYVQLIGIETEHAAAAARDGGMLIALEHTEQASRMRGLLDAALTALKSAPAYTRERSSLDGLAARADGHLARAAALVDSAETLLAGEQSEAAPLLTFQHQVRAATAHLDELVAARDSAIRDALDRGVFTGVQLASLLGISPSKVSSIRNRAQPAPDPDRQ